MSIQNVGAGQMEMLTKNFSVAEMSCNCRSCDAEMGPFFMAKLQVFREEFGEPMHITSGARCPSYNREVGGAKRSRHLSEPDKGIYARAVDIQIPDSEYRIKLVRLAFQYDFNGVGIGKDFVHLDDRRFQEQRLWTYY